MDNRAQKSILQTNSKPNSKSRRISWGEVKIKEFAMNDEVRNQLGDEYNITIADIHQNNTILEESIIEDSVLSIKDNQNNITTNILDNSILNRNSIDITKPINTLPNFSYRNSIDDYFPRITLCENSSSNIKDSFNKNRITINQISNDKDNEFRKRNSFNLRHTLDMLYNNNEEDNYEELSVSPINNAQKIYYDTKMASAAKILEEKRDNNDRITIYQIHHDKGSTPLQIKRNESDIDRRINSLINYITENLKIREKIAAEFEYESSDLDKKLKELDNEKKVLGVRKKSIKDEIDRLDKVYHETSEIFKINKYLFKMFGMRLLSSEFGILKLQLFKKINILFKFEEKTNLKFLESSNGKEFIKSPKLSFEFIGIAVKNESAQNMLKVIYEHIISGLYNNITISVSEFYDSLKRLIKLTSAFLYFCEVIYVCHTASIDMSMIYIREKKESQISFSLLNKIGFKIKFDFVISLINPFYGISMKDFQVININLSESNFSKSKNNALGLINEMKNFLQHIDKKYKNPIFFKDFIIKLNKKIFNL